MDTTTNGVLFGVTRFVRVLLVSMMCATFGAPVWADRDDASSLRPVRVHGVVQMESGAAAPGGLTAVARWEDSGEMLGRSPVDRAGRFALDLAAPARSKRAVRIAVVDAQRIEMGFTSLRDEALWADGVHIVTLRRPSSVGPSIEEVVRNNIAQRSILTSDGLTLWEAQSRRLRSVTNGEPGVPPEVRRAIDDLETLRVLAANVLVSVPGADRAFIEALTKMHAGESTPAAWEASLRAMAPGKGRLCGLDRRPTLGIMLAAYVLDAERVSSGNTNAAGVLSAQARDVALPRAERVDVFDRGLMGLAQGDIKPDDLAQVFKGGGPWAPLPSMPPLGEPGLSPWPDRPGDLIDIPCEPVVECVNSIADAASGFRLPQRCSHDDSIGSISPVAVCKDSEDVTVTIRPSSGQTFRMPAGCNVGFARTSGPGTLGNIEALEVLSSTQQQIVVKISKVDTSGCIGFYGGNTQPAPAPARACLKLGGFTDSIFTPIFHGRLGDASIRCTANNRIFAVGEPNIRFIEAVSTTSTTANADGYLSMEAEACAPVTIRWGFDFGEPVPQDLVNSMIRVSVLRAGQVVASGKGPSDSIVVNDETDATYTITAVTTRPDGQECGRTSATVRVERFHSVQLAGPSIMRANQPTPMAVRISCPAPVGGVNVSLSATPASSMTLPTNVVILEGQSQAQFDAIGSACSEVVIHAVASNHQPGSRHTCVFDAPIISSITPSVLPLCSENQTISISGSCFGCGPIGVFAERSGEPRRQLHTTVNTGSTSLIQADIAGLDRGSWEITVQANGMVSNAATLVINSSQPTIESISVTPTEYFTPCLDNGVAGQITVSNASRIVIKRGTHTLLNHTNSNCGVVDLGFSDTIQRSTTYTAEAFPFGDGGPTERVFTMGGLGANSIEFTNNLAEDITVWIIPAYIVDHNTELPNAYDAVMVGNGATAIFYFDDCTDYSIAATKRDTNQPHNESRDRFKIPGVHLMNIKHFRGDAQGEQKAVWANQ